TFRGSTGLDATIPVGASFAGVTLTDVHVALRAHDGGIDAEVSAALGLRIGPVGVAVDGMGVRSTLAFGDGGNVGVADLDVGFRAPTALALSIAAGPLTGSGSLVVDPEHGQYAGDVRLEFEGISVRAVGVLTTGPTGYSLLVLVSAEFAP